jgi:hypothetical protein
LAFISHAAAQDSLHRAKHNVVKLKAGNILYADDRTIFAKNDTVIELPIAIDFYIKREFVNSDKFYISLQETAYKNRWTRELHNIILVPEDTTKISEALLTQKSEVPFLPYRNMVIRKISFQKLNVFGPTIYAPDKQAKTWIGGVANKIHTKTRDGVIVDHLLFKKGDLIDPYTFADNERLLRDLPFIEDARIEVKNISATADSADIVVIVKDNLSEGLDFTTPDFKNMYVGFWDNNIFGTGQETDNTIYRNPGRLPYSGLRGYYKIRNIGGSFINSQIGYNAFGSKGYSLDLWRDFFTQRTKYAGELYFEKMDTYTRIETNQDSLKYHQLKGTLANFWIGRAFPIEKLGLKITNISNLIISAGIYNSYYSDRPPVASDLGYNYHNRTFFLSSFAFSSQGYYKTNLVYNYGRTEDIPYGLLLKFTSGIEKSEFGYRMYNGVSFAKANYVKNLGYLYSYMAVGGFTKDDRFVQGVFNLNSNFFTNLLVFGQYKLRQFINIGYTKGYGRDRDEFININGLSGIEGFRSDSTKGTQKFTLNLETICFTPFYLAGFRFAIFGFADFATVGATHHPVFSYPLYSGYGLGFRFRNEKFVFKTFQIRLAYYPYLPESSRGQFLSISEDTKFQPSNFNVKSPEIIKFQ